MTPELRPVPELPFLIVHGGVVWKVLWCLLVIGSLVGLSVLRTRRARRRARKEVEAKVRGAPRPGSGEVTLVGEIAEGSAITFARDEVETSSRSEKLGIVVDGERIELVGDVRVDHGAREQSTWLRIPRELPTNLVWPPGRLASKITRSVGRGDRVIVTASERIQDDASAGYRDHGARRVLVATNGPIVISAREPAGEARTLGIGWIALFAVASIFWGIGLRKVGSFALERVDEITELAQLEGLNAASIAAAMPGSRAELLERLERRPWEVRSDEALELGLALANYFGWCPDSMLLQAGRFEEALAAARRCGGRASVARALVYLGRFEEAAPLVSPDGDEWYLATILAIATGDWKRAAIGAERLPAAFSRAERKRFYTDDDAARFATQARCLGALFRFYAGERGTFAGVPDRLGNERCALLEALTLPDAEQIEAFDRMESWGGSVRWHARLLWSVAGGGAREEWRMGALVYDLGAEPWFGRIAAEAYRGNDPGILRYLDHELAVISVVHGDFRGAREHLQRGIEHGLSGYSAQDLAMQIAFREGSTLPVASSGSELDEVRTVLHARSGGELPPLHVYPASCEAEANRAARLARDGDGRALAAILKRCTISYIGIPTALWSVLPMVRSGREELARLLRYHRDILTTFSYDWVPFRFINKLMNYRELARFIGDVEEAQRLQQIIDRYSEMLADRRKLTAFLFWSM